MSDRHILLHSCCGPCTMYPLEALRQEGYRVSGYFDNPNIHPYREFRSRLDAYRVMAEQRGLDARIEEGYGLEAFLLRIKEAPDGVYGALSAERCGLCYRLRMERAAAACKEAGLEAYSTTLLVSPYQHHDLIREAGEAAAEAYGLSFLYRDFRPGFRRGQAMAREAGLYMQGYCGCVFSEYERYGDRK
ncbi:MAG: epoxyqueuosine reductase QueH [Clostridiales bacterium]|nr:epoxyqueuosine reductase QueH [Clostridiales bacterium]